MWKGTLLNVAQVLVILSFFVTLFTIKPLEAARPLTLPTIKPLEVARHKTLPTIKSLTTLPTIKSLTSLPTINPLEAARHLTLPTTKPLKAERHLKEMISPQGSNKVSFPKNKAPVSPSKPPEAESPVEYDTASTVLGGNKVLFPENKGAVEPSRPNPCTFIPKGGNGHCNK